MRQLSLPNGESGLQFPLKRKPMAYGGMKTTRMLVNILTSRWKWTPLTLKASIHAVRGSEDHYRRGRVSLPYDESALHFFL